MRPVLDAPGLREPVGAGDIVVDDENVGSYVAELPRQRRRGRRRAHDDDVGLLLDDALQADENGGMVVE